MFPLLMDAKVIICAPSRGVKGFSAQLHPIKSCTLGANMVLMSFRVVVAIAIYNSESGVWAGLKPVHTKQGAP